MSARENLRKWLIAPNADELLDAFAHELAERIRNHPWDDGCAPGCCDDDRGAQKAADLIDPEVSK